MDITELIDTLLQWQKDNFGVLPPFWVLGAEEFDELVDNNYYKLWTPVVNNKLSHGIVKCLGVTVVRFDGKLP